MHQPYQVLSQTEILLRTKRKLFLGLHGEHETLFSGRGMDFREVREYTAHDDIRHLNWKITARTGTPSVNLYNETKQIHVVLVYLNSAGMVYGAQKSKQQTATEVLTALGYAAIENHDTLTTLFYSQERQLWHKPSRHRGIIDLNHSTAQQINPIGQTIDFADLSQHLLKKIKEKSLIFLIGDFWEFTIESDLGYLASLHELNCVIIRDSEEEKLSLRGTHTLINPLSQKSTELSITAKTAARYIRLVETHTQQLAAHCKQHRITHQKIYTSEDTIEKLALLTRLP